MSAEFSNLGANDGGVEARMLAITTATEQLHRQALKLGQTRCLVLLDGGDRSLIADPVFAEDARHAKSVPTPVRLTPLAPSYWPHLLELDLQHSAHAALVHRLVGLSLDDDAIASQRQGLGQRICAWLFTGATAPQIASTLARNAIQPRAGAPRQWLRWYDPQSIDMFWTVVRPAQQAALLSRVDHWVYLDRSGGFAVLTPPTVDEEPSALLASDQWPLVDGIGAMNQAWLRGRIEQTLPSAPVDWPACLSALAQAQTRGVWRRTDCDAYAYHLLTVDAGFAKHQRIQEIHAAINDQQGYAALTDELDEDVWLQIRSANASRRASGRILIHD